MTTMTALTTVMGAATAFALAGAATTVWAAGALDRRGDRAGPALRALGRSTVAWWWIVAFVTSLVPWQALALAAAGRDAGWW